MRTLTRTLPTLCLALPLAAPLAAQDGIATPAVAPAPAMMAPSLALEPNTSLVFVDAGRAGPGHVTFTLAPVDTPQRRRAIEHSDMYYKRLTIHRWASYTMPPLFVGQYLLGQELIRKRDRGESYGSTRNAHSAVAGGIAGLFVVNTVTGVWNLYEDRNEPAGRTRRIFHVVTMLAADAGFVATGLTAEDEGGEGEIGGGGDDISTHRNLAYGSMGLAAVSAAVMWFWKD